MYGGRLAEPPAPRKEPSALPVNPPCACDRTTCGAVALTPPLHTARPCPTCAARRSNNPRSDTQGTEIHDICTPTCAASRPSMAPLCSVTRCCSCRSSSCVSCTALALLAASAASSAAVLAACSAVICFWTRSCGETYERGREGEASKGAVVLKGLRGHAAEDSVDDFTCYARRVQRCLCTLAAARNRRVGYTSARR